MFRLIQRITSDEQCLFLLTCDEIITIIKLIQIVNSLNGGQVDGRYVDEW